MFSGGSSFGLAEKPSPFYRLQTQSHPRLFSQAARQSISSSSRVPVFHILPLLAQLENQSVPGTSLPNWVLGLIC